MPPGPSEAFFCVGIDAPLPQPIAAKMPHWGDGRFEVAIEAMKRQRLGLAALTLVSQTGCFGKFALVRAV